MIEPYDWQHEYLQHVEDRFGWWAGVGCGKTIMALWLAKMRGAKHVLILCKKDLVYNWEVWAERIGIKVTVVSKEQFKKAVKERGVEDLPEADCVIIDEAHYWAMYTSQLFKCTIAYLTHNKPKIIWLLTGTPYMSSPWNLFSMKMLLGKNMNWYEFRKEFFVSIKMGPRFIWQPRKDRETVDKIVNGFDTIGRTMLLEDNVNMPPILEPVEFFQLTSSQIKAIRGIDDILPIQVINKRYQIENGTLKGDEYTPHATFTSDKFDRACDIIQQEGRIAVVCRHTLEINRFHDFIVANMPEKKVVLLTGATKDKAAEVEVIRQNPDDQFVILINGGVSEGYGLETVPYILFYSMTYALKDWVQLRGRLARGKEVEQQKSLTYHRLIVGGPKSVDMAVHENIITKNRDFQVELFNKDYET